MFPEEEEEERREEIGGLELFGELNDNLVVAGITAGSSLSRAPLRRKGLSLECGNAKYLCKNKVNQTINSILTLTKICNATKIGKLLNLTIVVL